MKLVYHPLSCVINKRFNTLLKKKKVCVSYIFALGYISSLKLGALYQILLHEGNVGKPKNIEFGQLVRHVKRFGGIIT